MKKLLEEIWKGEIINPTRVNWWTFRDGYVYANELRHIGSKFKGAYFNSWYLGKEISDGKTHRME